MRTLRHLVLAGLAVVCLSTNIGTPRLAMAQAAVSQAQGPVLDSAARRQAITTAARLLVDDYVYPDVGTRAAAMLTQNLDAGKYDTATTPTVFAAQVTKDLQEVTHDKHLNVFADGAPDETSGPPLPPSLFGFARADRLKGNIGYIVLNGFSPKVLSRQGADITMAALASTDALIIDLRNNDGGDPNAVSYLVSFFFDGKTPVHVNDLLWRKAGTTDYDRTVFTTEPTVPSYLGKPVYVLTGPLTFSGGEEFAYDMQALKRGTLIGEVTKGGANPGGAQPIGPGLILFVPTGRGENPVTHTNWEGKGVQPDIVVPADQTFATAYAKALHDVHLPRPVSVVSAEEVTEARLLPPRRTRPEAGGEAALRRLIAGMADGRPPNEILSGTMAWVAQQQLASSQADLTRLGDLQGLTFIEVDGMGSDIYEATFAHGVLLFTLAMEPDGKIALCWYRPR